ncbi:hypothetical protein DRJ22_05500 [Candidatus Woesearchaeota archaeon]|nr:MAG: hypothetical protein DRJ22_05500 [Candidatus Woesearchaeota archaeon]
MKRIRDDILLLEDIRVPDKIEGIELFAKTKDSSFVKKTYSSFSRSKKNNIFYVWSFFVPTYVISEDGKFFLNDECSPHSFEQINELREEIFSKIKENLKLPFIGPVEDNVVYVAGGLTNLNKEEEDKQKRFYEEIADIFERKGYFPYVPHKHTDPKKHKDIDPIVVYSKNKTIVANARLIVADISLPSGGVGIELEIGTTYNRRVIALVQEEKLKNRKVSRMMRGCFCIEDLVVFKDHDDALNKLDDLVKEKYLL